MQWDDLEEYSREADIKALLAYQQGTAEAPELYTAGFIKAADMTGPILFTASHESPDRVGDIIEVDGWQLTDFKKNPVFLWSHDNFRPPIGRVAKVTPEGKELLASVIFDSDDAFAAEVEGKYRRGIMRAVSVGFRPIEFEEIPRKASDEPHMMSMGGIRFKKQELLELSAVTIPAHPKALAKALASRRFLVMVPDLSAIPRRRPVSMEDVPEPVTQPPEKTDFTLFSGGIAELRQAMAPTKEG